MASAVEVPSLVGNQPTVGQFDPTSEPRKVTPEIVGQVPKSLVDAIIKQESGGRPGAVGGKGELGLMQITPGVAQQYGVKFGDLANPETNRAVGTRYLNDLMKRFNGNIMQALAAYNAGPSRVERGDIPDSTRKYVRKILESLSDGIEGTADAAELPGGMKNISNPWEKATNVANPWTTAPAAAATPDTRTWYERNVKPLQGPVEKALAYWPPGTPDFIKRLGTPEMAKDMSRAIVPDTGKQAAIQAALLGTGLGEFGLPMRLAAPALAGAGAGALETNTDAGESRGLNAVLGGAEGLGIAGLGEAAGGLLGVGGRMAGRGPLLKKTTEDVATEIGQQLPEVGKLQTADDLERAFTRKEAVDRVEVATRPVRDMAARASKAAGVKFQIPVMGPKGSVTMTDMSLPEAEKAISDLSDLGFSKGGIKTTLAAKQARQLAYQARGMIAQRLNSVAPGLGDSWLAARRQMGAAQALSRIFKDGIPFDSKTGQIDQPALANMLIKRWDDLVRNLGPDGAADLLKTVRRGAAGPVSDIPGERPHIGVRMHGPHMSIPSTYKAVGDVPWYMGKSASFQPAMSLGVAKGAQDLEDQQ